MFREGGEETFGIVLREAAVRKSDYRRRVPYVVPFSSTISLAPENACTDGPWDLGLSGILHAETDEFVRQATTIQLLTCPSLSASRMTKSAS